MVCSGRCGLGYVIKLTEMMFLSVCVSVFLSFFLSFFYSELEEALVVLPFSYVVEVLNLVNQWLKVRKRVRIHYQ